MRQDDLRAEVVRRREPLDRIGAVMHVDDDAIGTRGDQSSGDVLEEARRTLAAAEHAEPQ